MLQERILRTLEKSDSLDQRKLSKIAGVNESTISRYLNGFEGLNLVSVLKIVKHLYPEQEKEVMAEYVLTQKSRNARFALEYCDLNNLTEQMDYIIEQLSVSVNPVDKEWAKLYSLIQMYKKRSISMEELLMQVEVFDPKEIEMKIMKQILKGYIYVELGDYTSLTLHTKYIELFMKNVKNQFLRNCFNIRIGLTMNYVSLFRNEIEKAREYSFLILEQDFFQDLKAAAYHHLGHSYLFEDFDKAKQYMEQAINLYSKFKKGRNLNVAERNLSFLQSYWKIEREFTLPLDTEENYRNYIYYLIQKGCTDVARNYLNKIDVNSITETGKAFYYYYLGLLDNDKEYFYTSVEYFRKVGDRFQLKLPIDKLRTLGENESVLRIFLL